ncbi:hypothetical protein HID58_086409 [Brassica napus]|uniref:Uncharacterized protein n=1 Tax=Brassica napus TaxID=3708 RepID=A0ABQ7XSX3_BRANA|nr:hypothetical protein HID58_086409 [Brassica napus]
MTRNVKKVKNFIGVDLLEKLNSFDITRANQYSKLTTSPISIRFSNQTTFLEVKETINPIPSEVFMDTNTHLQNIVGEVFVIKTTYNDETQTIQRIMVNIRIEGNLFYNVCDFNNLATTNHHFQTLEVMEGIASLVDMLGAGAVKTNRTDRFNSASPEKIPDGDNAGMLDESDVDPALPTIRMNHLWRRSVKGRSHMWLNFTG